MRGEAPPMEDWLHVGKFITSLSMLRVMGHRFFTVRQGSYKYRKGEHYSNLVVFG